MQACLLFCVTYMIFSIYRLAQQLINEDLMISKTENVQRSHYKRHIFRLDVPFNKTHRVVFQIHSRFNASMIIHYFECYIAVCRVIVS